VARDHARRRKSTGNRKSATSVRQGAENTPRGRGLRLYLGGVVTGVFLSFIGWLATLPEPGTPETTGSAPPVPAEVPKPRFDFYTVLPTQEIEVREELVEPAADISKPTPGGAGEQYILQAGSFRQQEDARRRRAELILLGLNPQIEESQGDSGRVFRVYLGPFDSQDAMSRARGLTAGENIDTLVLKRGER